MALPRLLLASASPRRREIVRTLGLEVTAASVDADESEHPGELPGPYLERVVAAKLALALPLAKGGSFDGVIVADTTVVLGSRMLAKPLDADDNAAMVRALAGRTHEVWTRFAVHALESARTLAETVVTKVTVRALTEAEISGYVASGEGRDKAGGYAIQGLGSFAVRGIEGSYANVVGLPACELVSALAALDLLGPFPRS